MSQNNEERDAALVTNLRRLASEYQRAGDKLGVRMLEQRIQRILDRW